MRRLEKLAILILIAMGFCGCAAARPIARCGRACVEKAPGAAIEYPDGAVRCICYPVSGKEEEGLTFPWAPQ